MEYNVLKSCDIFYLNCLKKKKKASQNQMNARIKPFFPQKSSRLSCTGRIESLVISYSKPESVFSPLYTSILKAMLLEVEYIGCEFFFSTLAFGEVTS